MPSNGWILIRGEGGGGSVTLESQISERKGSFRGISNQRKARERTKIRKCIIIDTMTLLKTKANKWIFIESCQWQSKRCTQQRKQPQRRKEFHGAKMAREMALAVDWIKMRLVRRAAGIVAPSIVIMFLQSLKVSHLNQKNFSWVLLVNEGSTLVGRSIVHIQFPKRNNRTQTISLRWRHRWSTNPT